MPDSEIVEAHIPTQSQELLGEWDVPTDTLFLTDGALKLCILKTNPRTMAEFYQFLPANAAIELAAFREDFINGVPTAADECGYICNGYWVQERMTALMRNDSGRAVRILGVLKVNPIKDSIGFVGGAKLLSEGGIWLYDVGSGQIWHDAFCDNLLGYKEQRHYPITTKDSLFTVHPSEQEAVRRHYALFCGSCFLGDTITDVLRVRSSDGSYTPVLVRATVMERDEKGHAKIISGIMAPADSSAMLKGSRKNDNGLFQILDTMGSGQWNWDTRQDTVYFCTRYLNMLGYRAEDEEQFAKNWRNYIHPDDREKVRNVQNQVIADTTHGDTYECAYRIRSADGGWAWVFDRGCVTWRDAAGRAGHLIGSITNITTAQAERDKLEELIRHDTLTGLRSRAYCNLEIEHIEQNNIRPVSVISVDLTGLKMINDYLGHSKGDEVLMAAAGVLRSSLRRSDCIARMGGDEFLILLPGCDKTRGQKVQRKLKKAFADYNAGNPNLPVFVAIGLAVADTSDKSLGDVMACADERMYDDKRASRKEQHAVLKKIILERTGREVGADDRLLEA